MKGEEKYGKRGSIYIAYFYAMLFIILYWWNLICSR